MIELRKINFRYAGGTDAGGLVNIDLIIPNGQVILLCGQSGCGKTTLTRLVNGLIPNYYGEKYLFSFRRRKAENCLCLCVGQ